MPHASRVRPLAQRRVATPCCAHAWPCRSTHRLLVPYRDLAGSIAALCRDTVQQPTAPAVTLQNPVLQYNFFFSSQATTHPCNTIYCIAIQLPALQPSSLQYKNCIAIQFSTPTQLAIHFILQYKTYPNCNTILFLQYNWAVAYFKFLHQFLFFFFSFFIIYIYIYIYIYSNYFQQLEKSLKKITFFFHFLEHSNKFIKIYFTPFSSIVLLVKS